MSPVAAVAPSSAFNRNHCSGLDTAPRAANAICPNPIAEFRRNARRDRAVERPGQPAAAWRDIWDIIESREGRAPWPITESD